MPLISVIIPNYNHEKFLFQRIESVLEQTFQDFEIIIFDDASTDNSLGILLNYKLHPKVIHFVVNEQNSGTPFAQWDKGLKLSNGKYIWIAETDDFAEPNFLEKTVTVLENNKDSGLVYSDSRIIDSNGKEKGLWSVHKNSFFNTNKWSNNYETDGIDEIFNALLYKVTINNVSAVLFRKEILNEVIVGITKFKNVGDLYVYLSIAMLNKISYIAVPLNNYREHSNNATKKNTNNGTLYKERIQCFALFVNLINKHSNRKDKLRKACKFIIKKNAFKLVDFQYQNLLFDFLSLLSKEKILHRYEVVMYKFLFRIYQSELYKVSGLAKKTIKNRLT